MAIKCYVSGVEYKFTTESLLIREQAGQSSSSPVDVSPIGSAPPPRSLQSIRFDEDDVPFFLGYIQSVDAPEFISKYNWMVYSCTVLSAESVFNNRLISDSFSGKKTHEIIDQIFDDYLAEENLTKGTITSFDRLYEKYTVPRLTAAQVFTELGDAVGAVARISPTKVFSFTAKESFSKVDPPATISNIKKSETGQPLITIQYLSGANTETSLQTKSAYWVAEQTEQLLPYQVSELQGATIAGVSAGIGLKGVDESDTSKTFLWRYGENVVIVNKNATVKPAAGQLVAFVYLGFYSVEIEEENEQLKQEIAALSGLSGKIEAVEVDTTITNYADGKNKAYDLLSQADTREETITCQCEDIQSSSLLNIWELNYPEIFIEGEYVIVERSISFRYDVKLIQVKLKNRGFYSRYGTVLNKNDKKVNDLSIRTDDVVIKRSSFIDMATAYDSFTTKGYAPYVYPSSDANIFFPTLQGATPMVGGD